MGVDQTGEIFSAPAKKGNAKGCGIHRRQKYTSNDQSVEDAIVIQHDECERGEHENPPLFKGYYWFKM